MLGNIYHYHYDKLRRRETPHIHQDKKGCFFPPKSYEGGDVSGPIYNHPVKLVVPEPGIQFQCPDCAVGNQVTKYDGYDHFKYGCGKWQCRIRLQKGFAALKSHNLVSADVPHHLNNDAINVMISQGVTLERVAKQPSDWLPNEPLYDYDPITGEWESTGVVPLTVWMNLPSDLRMEPLPQDNSLEAKFYAQGDAGRRGAVQMNAPRRLEEKQEMEHLEVWNQAQQDLKEKIAPNYQNLLAEYDALQARVERLTSQIASFKFTCDVCVSTHHINPVVGALLHSSFDPVGHPEYITRANTFTDPTAPVAHAPPSINVTKSFDDVDYMNSL